MYVRACCLELERLWSLDAWACAALPKLTLRWKENLVWRDFSRENKFLQYIWFADALKVKAADEWVGGASEKKFPNQSFPCLTVYHNIFALIYGTRIFGSTCIVPKSFLLSMYVRNCPSRCFVDCIPSSCTYCIVYTSPCLEGEEEEAFAVHLCPV